MAERSTRAAGQMTAGPPASAASSAEAEARSAADALRAGRDQALDDAKTMVRDMAESQRRKAVDTLGGVAQALHRTAKDLGAENQTMARYTDVAAERMDDVVRYLRQTEWREMVGDAESFARRQPWWVIGGAVAAGFVAARMIKGPAAEATQEAMGQTMGQTAGPGAGWPPPVQGPQVPPAVGEPT